MYAEKLSERSAKSMVGYNRRNHEGIDNIIKYGKPEMLKQTVSATSGTPEEIAAGLYLTMTDMLLIINLKVSLSIQLREWGYLLM